MIEEAAQVVHVRPERPGLARGLVRQPGSPQAAAEILNLRFGHS